MRSIIIVALLLVSTANCLFMTMKKPLITKEFVDKLNNMPDMTWKASVDNGVVTGATEKDIKRLLGTLRDKPNPLPKREFTEKEKAIVLPEEFDSAKNWPNCKTIPFIWDQSNCGSCWAMGAAGAISDRYCTMGNKNFFISSRDILSCCKTCGFGCNGGYEFLAWQWWVDHGLVAEECQPYPFPHCEHHSTGKYPPCSKLPNYDTPKCEPKCTGNTTTDMKRYKGTHAYQVNGEEDYQRDLMAKGPFEVAFDVYEDFMAYKSGVYQHVSGRLLGGHAVRLVGWGVMNGVKYWKIANSWNEDWGMNGYFLIKRGTNECGIDNSGSAGNAV